MPVESSTSPRRIAEVQVFGPSFAAFWDRQQGARWEAEQPGHNWHPYEMPCCRRQFYLSHYNTGPQNWFSDSYVFFRKTLVNCGYFQFTDSNAKAQWNYVVFLKPMRLTNDWVHVHNRILQVSLNKWAVDWAYVPGFIRGNRAMIKSAGTFLLLKIFFKKYLFICLFDWQSHIYIHGERERKRARDLPLI